MVGREYCGAGNIAIDWVRVIRLLRLRVAFLDLGIFVFTEPLVLETAVSDETDVASIGVQRENEGARQVVKFLLFSASGARLLFVF